jgi:hypothetical protein
MHPQILVDAAGHITLAWDEVVNGVRQAALRTLKFDEAGQPLFGSTNRLGPPDAPSSYPMLVSTPRGTTAVYVEGRPGTSVIRTSLP